MFLPVVYFLGSFQYICNSSAVVCDVIIMNAPRQLLRIQCIGCIARILGKPVQRVILPTGAHLQTPGSQHNYGQLLRPFHCSAVCYTSRPSRTQLEKTVEDETLNKDKSLVTHDDLFERAARDSKTKADFNRVVDVFSKKDIRRRGHVEFIYAALKKMPEFGVERDITVYNKLLDVFPKEVFMPRNFIQRMFNHYPRQQECGVQLLEQMENYGVCLCFCRRVNHFALMIYQFFAFLILPGIMPNVETKVLLAQIFGEKSHPMRKYQRIMYWFPKFKHANPFPIPHVLPSDPVELARFSLTRIADDLDAKITIYQVTIKLNLKQHHTSRTTIVQKFGVSKIFLKKVFYAQAQGCIYLIKNTVLYTRYTRTVFYFSIF
uniref:ECSIT signaling integrator n=1 Tax=Cyprinus carpio TaxID=7962 RepID=A0A8C2E4Y3_CYPCA